MRAIAFKHFKGTTLKGNKAVHVKELAALMGRQEEVMRVAAPTLQVAEVVRLAAPTPANSPLAPPTLAPQPAVPPAPPIVAAAAVVAGDAGALAGAPLAVAVTLEP